MDEKYIATIVTIFAAGYITHKFTKKRFKEELRVKKSEKNINDVKEIINDFEKKLSERVFLTRGYMYDIISKTTSEDSRSNYKKVILQWNVDFDYRANRLSRFGLLNQIKEIDRLQKELSEFHSFLVSCSNNNFKNINSEEVYAQIDKLKKFQTRTYKFITNLHFDVDNQWDKIFKDKLTKKTKLIYSILDCLFKGVVCYFMLMLFLFLISSFLH